MILFLRDLLSQCILTGSSRLNHAHFRLCGRKNRRGDSHGRRLRQSV